MWLLRKLMEYTDDVVTYYFVNITHIKFQNVWWYGWTFTTVTIKIITQQTCVFEEIHVYGKPNGHFKMIMFNMSDSASAKIATRSHDLADQSKVKTCPQLKNIVVASLSMVIPTDPQSQSQPTSQQAPDSSQRASHTHSQTATSLVHQRSHSQPQTQPQHRQLRPSCQPKDLLPSSLSPLPASFKATAPRQMCSTSPPGGNQVDGLPPAPVLYEALEGPLFQRDEILPCESLTKSER